MDLGTKIRLHNMSSDAWQIDLQSPKVKLYFIRPKYEQREDQ